MRIRLRPEARLDIFQASTFFDDRSDGLGDKFVRSIFEDFERLEYAAGIHEKRGRYYRIFSRRFPYMICYDVIGDEILVIAVLSCRLRPDAIDETLDER
jgi:hypothetical protein